jgi:predicted nucleotidyltransferase
LESLFCRKEDVLFSTEEGRLLRENKALFLSKKIKFTLSGYAIAQLKRIVHHRAWLLNPPTKLPVRADFGLPERTLIPADQIAAANAVIKKQLDSWEPDLSCVSDDSMRIQIMEKINTTMSEVLAGTTMAMEDERQRRWHAAVVATGLPENLIHQLERERQYQSQKSNWDSYVNWKNTRNPARAALEEKFGYDCKHGAHLVRLMRMAEEVLTTGQVNVWRGGIDRDELLFIRNGGWNFDRLQQFAADMDQKLEALYKENPAKLPHSADRNGVNKLLQQIYWGRQGYPIAKSDQS